jgi:hypothetical protein
MPQVPPEEWAEGATVAGCCAAVKALSGAAVSCICHYLGSPAARENISLEKVFVTNKCGVTIPANCGSESSLHT